MVINTCKCREMDMYTERAGGNKHTHGHQKALSSPITKPAIGLFYILNHRDLNFKHHTQWDQGLFIDRATSSSFIVPSLQILYDIFISG